MVFVLFVFYESNEEPGSSVGNASSVFEDRNLLLAVFSFIIIILPHLLPLTPRLTPTQHS